MVAVFVERRNQGVGVAGGRGLHDAAVLGVDLPAMFLVGVVDGPVVV